MTRVQIILRGLLSLVLGLSACADDPQAIEASTVTPEWQQVFVGKADQRRAGVHLSVELIELQPGESHSDAVLRVLGTYPSATIGELINGSPEPLRRPEQTVESREVCNDDCNFAHDGVCDEPGYCATGTDCSDCGGTPNVPSDEEVVSNGSPAAPDACVFQGQAGSCTPDADCGGRFTEGGCPGGMTCCVPHDAPASDAPGPGQACGQIPSQGICVPQGECRASGATGSCGAGLECCLEDPIMPKAAVTASVALVAWGVEAIIVAYAAWEISRAAQSMIGHIQTSTHGGHSVLVGLSTDAASIDLARSGALPNAAIAAGTQGVGEVSSDYFEDRSAESAGADSMTCNRSTHQRLNDQKNHNCKHSGPRVCPGGLTRLEIQDRISRGSRCCRP